MKKFAKILPWLKNKYVLTVIAFIVWMTFFDRNDFISQYSYRTQLDKLQDDKEYYFAEIDVNQKNTYELKSNPQNLERFAREKYLMKKDNEEIFLIVRK